MESTAACFEVLSVMGHTVTLPLATDNVNYTFNFISARALCVAYPWSLHNRFTLTREQGGVNFHRATEEQEKQFTRSKQHVK